MELMPTGMPADYKHFKVNVKSGEKMKIHLAPGGGWAARIVPM